jgi:hypothetical protein
LTRRSPSGARGSGCPTVRNTHFAAIKKGETSRLRPFVPQSRNGPEADLPVIRPGQFAALESECDDILCLRAFLALRNSERYLLAFCQGFEARVRNVAVMCEHVGAGFLLDEAETFCFVKPFNGAGGSRNIYILIFKSNDGLIEKAVGAGMFCYYL